MPRLRTEEMETRYSEYQVQGGLRECPLCARESIEDFSQWKIIDNKFPYDLIAKMHHMLVPKRHIQESELTEQEKNELAKIKEEYLQDHYDYIIEAAHKNKTIPGHFHLHVIVAKK